MPTSERPHHHLPAEYILDCEQKFYRANSSREFYDHLTCAIRDFCPPAGTSVYISLSFADELGTDFINPVDFPAQSDHPGSFDFIYGPDSAKAKWQNYCHDRKIAYKKYGQYRSEVVAILRESYGHCLSEFSLFGGSSDYAVWRFSIFVHNPDQLDRDLSSQLLRRIEAAICAFFLPIPYLHERNYFERG